MRVLVCGSRNHEVSLIDMGWELECLDIHGEGWESLVVIHGGARGVDASAKRWAEHTGTLVIGYPADWEKHGRSGGPIRNAEMLTGGKPDVVLAFWDGRSRGTLDMITRATKGGVRVHIVPVAGEEGE